MNAQKLRLLFLNVGHFADHLFMLIFAKAAFSAGLAFGLGGTVAGLLLGGFALAVFLAAYEVRFFTIGWAWWAWPWRRCSRPAPALPPRCS